jgi:uncharacterized protein (DUF302 family)/uncharacterized membrane protein YidH (DUF202 family)
MTERPEGSAADYLAAERTFLAWIRTGLALMGFGFVVARFGLFLEAMLSAKPDLPLRPVGISLGFGTALIVLGIVVTIWSAWDHIRLVRELKRGGSGFARASSLALAVAAALTALGIAIAIYLVSVPQPGHTRLENPHEKTPQEKTLQEKAMNTENGIVTIPCHQTVDRTVERLEEILHSTDVKVFALIDHSGEAEKAGMQMRPTKVLIFGNPKAGTPLMIASPGIAIDLPLRILVAEDAEGKVWISYNDPYWLQARHGLPADLVRNIAVIETLARRAAE